MWDWEWWRLYKTTTNVKPNIREKLPCRLLPTEHQLLERVKKGNLFGHFQCDVELPENLRTNFADFPLLFKNTLVSTIDIGDPMKTDAEEEGIISQPPKM